jgi:hypothetical protein
MTISLLFDEKIKTQIGGLEIDGMLEEPQHIMSSEITSNPVEGGVNTSDHIINAPKEYVITGGRVSNQIVGLTNIFSFENRVVDAFQFLEELRDKRELFTVVSELKVYDNCFFTSLVMKQFRSDTLTIDMAFRQLVITSSEVVDSPVAANAENNATNRKNPGNQNTTQSTDSTTSTGGSILSNIKDYAGF